ncbi:effector-associated constant component EACC1 [Streptomyces sp. CA-250714]|uniref:effector-associated constant component EACC1 n=1 Tax=Streptomyces sp. CA-250714 TaxID=3240060 RepID=UPI003D91418A
MPGRRAFRLLDGDPQPFRRHDCLVPCRRRVQAFLTESGAQGGERATLDFYAWLRQTSDVREHAAISLRLAQQDDVETMRAAEIIDLVLGHGFAALNLAVAYASWRATRPSAPR